VTLTGKWEHKKILMTVKAYPQPSQTYGEAVCTTGITEDGKWIRLYPMLFRELPEHQRFKKYQWIEANVCKSTSDYRPESYKIDHDTIKLLDWLDTKSKWQKRKSIILPLEVKSLEELDDLRKTKGLSIGLIKPRSIVDFVVEKVSEDWSEKQTNALNSSQMSLFDMNSDSTSSNTKKELEKIPYKFSYSFFCDDERCNGHQLQILDWELGEAYRSWSKQYPHDILFEKIKQRFFDEFITKKELYLYLGTLKNLHQYGTFSITGVFYPPA
jgi:hypothetical protein